MEAETGKGDKKRSPFSSFWTIFMHADATDMLLMTVGFVGAAGSGFTTPFILLVTTSIMNNLGAGPSTSTHFIDNVNKVRFSPLLFPRPASISHPSHASFFPLPLLPSPELSRLCVPVAVGLRDVFLRYADNTKPLPLLSVPFVG